MLIKGVYRSYLLLESDHSAYHANLNNFLLTYNLLLLFILKVRLYSSAYILGSASQDLL